MIELVLAIGLVIGLLLGLLGAGGTIVAVPALVYLLGQDVASATATSLFVGITALVGVVAYRRAGEVRWRTALVFGAAGLIGALPGAWLSQLLPGALVLLLFAGVLLLAAVLLLRRRSQTAQPAEEDCANRTYCLVAGLAGVGVGFATGLFGVGGGFLVVPALAWALRFSMPQAMATSLAIIALVSASALFGHLLLGPVDLAPAVPLVVGSAIGIAIGAFLARRAPEATLWRSFATLLVVLGLVLGVQNGAVLAGVSDDTTKGWAPAGLPAVGQAEEEEGVNVGQRAPDFLLPTLDGGEVRLSDLRGKAVLINFWASWCPPCREEMPALEELHQEYRDQGLVVLAINFGENADTVRPYVEEGGHTFPVVLDEATEVAITYQASTLPTSYFVDAEGIVRDRAVGTMTASTMRAKAERVIDAAGQPPAQPSSVFQAAGPANEQVVAEIGEQKVTMGDVNRAVDALLALERLHTGTVLDPLEPADQEEIKQRQAYIVEAIIDTTLLADAARREGLQPDHTAVDNEMAFLAEEAGGEEALAAEFAKHGVTVDDVRALYEQESLAQGYVFTVIGPTIGDAPPAEVINDWLENERAQRGVQVYYDSND